MGITELIDEADKLEMADRQPLMSHLVLRRIREHEACRKELARRLDDKNPGSWIGLEELEARLRDKGSGKSGPLPGRQLHCSLGEFGLACGHVENLPDPLSSAFCLLPYTWRPHWALNAFHKLLNSLMFAGLQK